jgi:beta-glucanase (GH16 family)
LTGTVGSKPGRDNLLLQHAHGVQRNIGQDDTASYALSRELGRQPDVFFDDFSGDSLDDSKWLVASKQWGGAEANGGVVADNVAIRDGKLILTAHGDQYDGPVRGVNKDGSQRPHGRRTGASIATMLYFTSGSYEVRMRVAPELGVCSAIWTFHYEEYYPGDAMYQEKPVGGADYYAVNHEIDIEMPGRPQAAHTNIGFDRALMNTWVGENDDEYTVSYTKLAEGQDNHEFHTYRFDWHTGDEKNAARVDFYVDGRLVQTNTKHVPTLAGRLWLGAWFPAGWAGTPNFRTAELEVDWVRITPFHELGDAWNPESFPTSGWADAVPLPPAPGSPAFFDDFSDGLVPARWLVAEKNWGGQLGKRMSYNGGVLADNVVVRGGKLILTANGNLYDGPIRGMNKDGSRRTDGKRTGAAVATRAYFGSARYEVRMKVAPVLGVCTSVWTFHYQEYYPGHSLFKRMPVGGEDYYAVNHEIDIEMPGRPQAAHSNISFDRALLNTWIGENDEEYSVSYTDLGAPQDDNQFHTYRFDWHTGGGGQTPRVDFYVDDRLVQTNKNHVPSLAGRLWIAAWFPNGWAGKPHFNTANLEIDWVRITPFREAGDRWMEPETFPADGWSPRYPTAEEDQACQPTPTAPTPTSPPTTMSKVAATSAPTVTTTQTPTSSTTRSPTAGSCLPCGACAGQDRNCPPGSYCRWNGVCQGFPMYNSFDPQNRCCGNPLR